MMKCSSDVIVYMHVAARETSPFSRGTLDSIADLIAISSRELMTRSIVDGVHFSPSEWIPTFGSPACLVRGNP